MPPLIPYPNVPAVAGVPPLPQAPPGYVYPYEEDGDSFDSSDTTAQDNTPTWSITDTDGNYLLQPDSVIDFEYRGEMKIPTYPIEQGSFQSYNKVPIPYDARMTVACNGNGEQTREGFLTACELLRESLDTVVITTPDAIYDSVNLVHYDYRREARQGVTLLLVQLWFNEIRVAPSTAIASPSQTNPVVGTPTPSTVSSSSTISTAPTGSDVSSAAVTNPAQPDGASPQSNGQVSPTQTTSAQTTPPSTAAQSLPAGYTQNVVTGVVYDPSGQVDQNRTIDLGPGTYLGPASTYGPQSDH